MKAISQVLFETLRVGPDDWFDDGPFYVCLTVTHYPNGVCFISGLDKPLNREHWIAIVEWAHKRDVKCVQFVRMRKGRKQLRTLPIEKWLAMANKQNATAPSPNDPDARDGWLIKTAKQIARSFSALFAER